MEPKSLHEMDFFLLFDYIMQARILIAQGMPEAANGLLQQLREKAETDGRITRLIEILLLQALAFQAGGDTARAMTPLEQAVTRARAFGILPSI